MHPIQARVKITGSRIQKIEPQFGGVTIISEREEVDHFPGAWMMPGFVDSHAHIYGLGCRLLDLSLYDCGSAEECADKAQRHEERHGTWLTGMGWNETLWESGEMPDHLVLDHLFPDTPVYLSRADGHAAWVNSEAMKLAGIGSGSADPQGGSILKDKNNKPTGILIDSAMDLVRRLIPQASEAQIRRRIEAATQEYVRLGVTEVHDMDVSPSLLEQFREPAEKGRLPVRVQSYVRGQGSEWLHERLLPAGGEFLRVYAVKFYADGALGSRGAHLLDDYSDEPGSRGLSLQSKAELRRKVKSALEFGWNVATHAIGDAANREVLDIYEMMRREGIADQQVLLRIEHAQIVHPDDQQRFGRWNITPAVQPIHCTSDAAMAEQRLGATRCRYAYPWRSLRNNGAILAGGSDAPIESPDPLSGIEAFCRRIPMDREQPWYPEECITREEALMAYTTWAHEAADVAYRRGRLKAKLDADFVVLDRNLLTCAESDISTTKVLATVTGGKIRYRAGESGGERSSRP